MIAPFELDVPHDGLAPARRRDDVLRARSASRERFDVCVDRRDFSLDARLESVDVIERGETNISTDRGIRGDLVESTRSALYLRGFHRARRDELVLRLFFARREGFVKLLLDTRRRFHRQFDGVDTLVGQTRVEPMSVRGEVPRNSTGGADAWLAVRAVHPHDWSWLAMVQPSLFHESVNTDAGTGSLFAGDEHARQRSLELRFKLGELREERRHKRDVAEARSKRQCAERSATQLQQRAQQAEGRNAELKGALADRSAGRALVDIGLRGVGLGLRGSRIGEVLMEGFR